MNGSVRQIDEVDYGAWLAQHAEVFDRDDKLPDEATRKLLNALVDLAESKVLRDVPAA